MRTGAGEHGLDLLEDQSMVNILTSEVSMELLHE